MKLRAVRTEFLHADAPKWRNLHNFAYAPQNCSRFAEFLLAVRP